MIVSLTAGLPGSRLSVPWGIDPSVIVFLGLVDNGDHRLLAGDHKGA